MTTSTQPSEWIETLDQISRELERTVQELERLEAQPIEPAPTTETSFEKQIADSQEQLAQIYACVAKAGEQVKEAELVLREEETSLSQWIESAKDLHQQLTAK